MTGGGALSAAAAAALLDPGVPPLRPAPSECKALSASGFVHRDGIPAAKNELSVQRMSWLPSRDLRAVTSRVGRFKLGESVLSVGLTEPAVKLISHLWSPSPSGIAEAVSAFSDAVSRLRDRPSLSYDGYHLRADGVIGLMNSE